MVSNVNRLPDRVPGGFSFFLVCPTAKGACAPDKVIISMPRRGAQNLLRRQSRGWSGGSVHRNKKAPMRALFLLCVLLIPPGKLLWRCSGCGAAREHGGNSARRGTHRKAAVSVCCGSFGGWWSARPQNKGRRRVFLNRYQGCRAFRSAGSRCAHRADRRRLCSLRGSP